MSIKQIIILFMLLLALGTPGASAGVFSDILQKLSITSYSSNVPVTIDYQNQQNYFVLSANIGGRTDELNLVLPESTQFKIDDNTAIKTGQSVSITLKPGQPYSTTTLLKGSDFRYISNIGSFGLGRTETPVPYYDVSGGTWLTKSAYSISLLESQGGVQASSNVEVSYLDRQIIYLRDLRGNTATFENQGTLANGISVPSGSFVVVIDPFGMKHLYDKIGFQSSLQRATDSIDSWFWKYNLFGYWAQPTWGNYWETMKTNGLPSEVPLSGQLSYPTDTSIKITYPTGSYSAQVVAYIPNTMANSIIINLHASKPEITDKSLTSVTEGEGAILTVKVTNVGTEDYIKVSPTSNFYTFTPLSDSRQYVKAGDVATYSWRAVGVDVPGDAEATVNILAEGSASYATTTATAMIYDKPTVVYCDPVRKIIAGCGEKNTWKLQVNSYLPDGTTVYSAGPIYINGELKANGMWSGDVPKGDYVVSGINTTGYYAPTPIKVTIINQDRTANLIYSNTPKSQEAPKFDWENIIWLIILITIIYAIYHFGIWAYVLPIVKMIKHPLALLANPYVGVVALVVLVGVLILLWRIYSLFSNIGSDLLGLIGW